ncbi:MAG: hypothetical protein PV340_00680 [Wolbachia sp.]|nr:hypothetical protein [Wolbachia sp.]MDD9336496.1 hypothetical protein [Wolbachia sp.]
MSIKNKISKSIKQQFTAQYYDNYLAYAVYKCASGDISGSITLCVTGICDCQTKYIGIAKSFGITKKEVEQGDIASIKSKIESEATKEGGEFFELFFKFDQSLREQSETSIIQILNSSAEEMLKSFCWQYYCNAQENSSPENKANYVSTKIEHTVLSEATTEESSAGWRSW